MTEIRTASAADLDEVVVMDAALFGVNAWSRAVLSADFAGIGDTRTVVVAVGEEGTCGYGVLLALRDVADLQRIGVSARHQRAGVGTRLLVALIERAAQAGCAELMLEVEATNVAALALYRRHSFEEIARRPRYYPDGGDAVVMRRGLGEGWTERRVSQVSSGNETAIPPVI